METVVCPFCNGSGCPNCGSSGQILLSGQQLQQLQTLSAAQEPGALNYSGTFRAPQGSGTLPGSRITISEAKTKFSAFLAFLILVAVAGGAFFSFRIFKTFYPFLAVGLSLAVLGTALASLRSSFFKFKPPADLLTAIDKLKLQKQSFPL